MGRKDRRNINGDRNSSPAPASVWKFTGRHATVAGICALLVLAVLAVFGQTVRHGFVNVDDDWYVLDKNPCVSQGLTPEGVKWAFTAYHAANWHPLTWLSHMADCQVYGLWPGGHHLTSVAFHAAAALLLFLALLRMTGATWPSALVAALFAIHPLRVESVAWVAERKDVLSGLFFMATLLAYAHYATRPLAWYRYVPVVLAYALGLMCKPMLVTLPFVLLLLDYWPLERLRESPERIVLILLEKVPLLLLAGMSCAVTVAAQSQVAAIKTGEQVPWSGRWANAIVSYAAYLGQMFYPADLAVYYPHPLDHLPMRQVIGAAVLLAAITAAVAWLGRKRGYWIVGWLWYVGTLVPVIGLIQVGTQARADRYTYLSLLGITVALVWAAADASKRWAWRPAICATGAGLLLAALACCAWRQTATWHDSVTLWHKALASTVGNDFAHNNLGVALNDLGKEDAAIEQFRQAVEINPKYADAQNNLGIHLHNKGKFEEAILHYEQALAANPDFPDAHNNLSATLYALGRKEEAIAHLRKALEACPDHALANANLGTMLLEQGKTDEAIEHFRDALAVRPQWDAAHLGLAHALKRQGNIAEAAVHFDAALAINPRNNAAEMELGAALARLGQFGPALQHLRRAAELEPANRDLRLDVAWLLATCPDGSVRDGAAAIAIAGEVCQATQSRELRALDVLAAAYAATGRFSEAEATLNRALALLGGRAPAVARELGQRLELYRAGKPFRATSY